MTRWQDEIGWTEAKVEALKTLWGRGLSASQIAKQITGVTRCAVIGKAHRLKLASPGRPSKPALAPRSAKPKTPREPRAFSTPTPAPRVPPAAPPAPAQPYVERPALVLEPGACCGLMDLTDKRCKWPIGDPLLPNFAYCGRTKPVDGGPYRDEHAEIAYAPGTPKKTSASSLARSLRKYLAA